MTDNENRLNNYIMKLFNEKLIKIIMMRQQFIQQPTPPMTYDL